MGWTDPATIPIAAGNPVASTALLAAITGDLSYLFAAGLNISDLAMTPPIPNNSFEADVNGTAGASMTAWTWAPGTGGTGTVVNTDQNHGANSFKMVQDTTAGHTAGTLTNSSFFVVSPSFSYIVSFMLKCSRADVKNQVIINWYAADQSFISSTTIKTISNGSSPTSWTEYASNPATPPATAMFAKIQLQGGQDTVTPPGATTNIFWDGIQIYPRQPLSASITYTSANTFTVPSGCFLIRVVAMGKRAVSTINFGGHIEISARVKPGDTMAVMSFGIANAAIPGGPTITANNASSGTDGTTSNNGDVNLTGGSTLPAPAVVVYY